jgi:type IV secretion system protein VirB10
MPDATREQFPESQQPGGGEIRDRAKRPAGLLPKNTQTYVVLGITAIMVGAIAFSGGGSPSKSAATTTPKTQAVIDPSLARIQEYRERIDEQARKLAAEQAQLEQTKQALGLPAATQASTAGGPMPAGAYPPSSQLAPPLQPQRPEKSAVETEKEKREYQSLFASNVALTYRKDSVSPASEAATAPAVSSTAAAPPYFPWPYPASAAPATPVPIPQVRTDTTAPDNPTQKPADESGKEKEEIQREHHPIDPSLQKASGKAYRIFEGTIIEAVLTNRLDGGFNGPVNCLVTTDVYSHDLQHVLIPKGSRVLGEVKRNDQFGQQRLAVFFHRVIMPDGYSASLDQFKGLSQIGETGLRDQVNHHYIQIFGVSLAVGALAGLSDVNTGYGLNASTLDAYRQGFGASLSQSSLRILDRYLNVLPTFTIREGHRVKVILSDDLMLPAYDRHNVPPDL